MVILRDYENVIWSIKIFKVLASIFEMHVKKFNWNCLTYIQQIDKHKSNKLV